jgi:multidrug efflux pump subunit AcrB
MVKFLINRPIAVCMAFLAFFILGIITYLNVPVSLLPNIAIPEITVQVSGKNMSARELENTVVTPIRQQLLQIGKMRDIRTETRDGSALIRLSFEFGVDTDLSFIEVNEKIDAAMNYIPRDVDRPRVIKASATDIPVFTLNLTLKDETAYEEKLRSEFLDLCELTENVIKRRIEQRPEVAMVDITGMINKEVVILPDNNLLAITGITLSDIETALNNNNIEPGSMIVRDGYYEYNIRFSAVLRTVEDIRNIYIRKNDKIFQLRDLAQVEIAPEKEKGLALYNGKRAIMLSVIKQADENMSKMQNALNNLIDQFKNDYPSVEFNVSQNQTELLNYTIANLQQNLILAFLFVWLVSAFFMKDVRSPLIIGLSLFVSLVICLLFFYLFNISLNVISLTGLILALGMMIDNSIIVTDNISQYRERGLSIEDACVKGTNEVIAPMLSSAFTTISIFVPLVFLSGIAGAIFFDQAFSVTVGLLVSYFTGIMLLPVLYKLLFSIRFPWERKTKENVLVIQQEERTENLVERFYSAGMDWVFAHKTAVIIFFIVVLPLSYVLFTIIPKERMPDISQNELLGNVEWNENLHVGENRKRTEHLLQFIDNKTLEHSAWIAQQQFVLNTEKEKTSSEMQVYLKTVQTNDIPIVKEKIEDFLRKNYPLAIVAFKPAGNIFERIFTTGDPDLVVEYYTKNPSEEIETQSIRLLEKQIQQLTGETPVGVALENQLSLYVDREKLLLYRVSYDEIHQALKTGFKENQFAVLRSYQQYIPIVLGNEGQNVQQVIDNIMLYTVPDEIGVKYQLPLSIFVSTVAVEDLKTIVAGRNGEYIPLAFYNTDQVEKIIRVAKERVNEDKLWEVDFSGSFFSNRKMINELIVILLISVLLMYFILAAQFESFSQPLIVLVEIPIDIVAAMGLLLLAGHSLNLMSAIGIVVTCGIVINDSILKIDVINQLRKEGYPLMEAIHEGGRRRLKAILLTSLTTIVCMAPLLFSNDLGSELEKPLAIATIGGMVVGTPVSLFVVPLIYWMINKKKSIV